MMPHTHHAPDAIFKLEIHNNALAVGGLTRTHCKSLQRSHVHLAGLQGRNGGAGKERKGQERKGGEKRGGEPFACLATGLFTVDKNNFSSLFS